MLWFVLPVVLYAKAVAYTAGPQKVQRKAEWYLSVKIQIKKSFALTIIIQPGSVININAISEFLQNRAHLFSHQVALYSGYEFSS